MLKQLNNTYFIIASLIYMIFLFSTSDYFISLYVLHSMTFVVYYAILTYIYRKNKNYYTKEHLFSLIFIFSCLLVIIYNYTSYVYNNNLFVFSEADAVNYYYTSLKMASKSFTNSVQYYLTYRSYEDLGAVLISSSIYRIDESKLLLNLVYIFTGLMTAHGIYRISSQFMSLKYAFICTVAYSLSSFVVWFHASGLKESFMCMLVVLFFDRYFQYIKNKNILQIGYASIFLTALLLFRPALLFFLVGAVGLGVVLQRRKGLSSVFIIIFIFATFIFLYPIYERTHNRYLMAGDLDHLLITKKSMIIGGTQFTYATNLLAQLIGPMPTISPDVKVLLSFYSAGLIYKILISILFWFGVYQVFKLKINKLYPLIFFAFFEMISLLIILEGLELRKSLPHFFVFYIIAFWFMDKYDLSDYFKSKRIKQKYRFAFNLSAFIVVLLIVVWNKRYQGF